MAKKILTLVLVLLSVFSCPVFGAAKIMIIEDAIGNATLARFITIDSGSIGSATGGTVHYRGVYGADFGQFAGKVGCLSGGAGLKIGSTYLVVGRPALNTAEQESKGCSESIDLDFPVPIAFELLSLSKGKYFQLDNHLIIYPKFNETKSYQSGLGDDAIYIGTLVPYNEVYEYVERSISPK